MGVDQIVNMVMRIFARRMINIGVKKGIDVAARRGKPEAAMTPEDREQARAAQVAAKRARQAVRIGRRLGK
ncbi:MAG: hypothetical protein K0B00_10525 [Rhodobacteraceae bacterium]|nr:hypothetical protein [Paracoccaceae bacterium]